MSGQDANEDYFALLCDVFHAAPITRFVRQTMRVPEVGVVEITLHPDGDHHHGGGRVHGGILALLLDNAGYFASATTSGGNWVVTTEFKVQFLDSVGLEDVVGTGRVLRAGRHIIHTEMRAESASGKLIATALGTYTTLPRKFRRPLADTSS